MLPISATFTTKTVAIVIVKGTDTGYRAQVPSIVNPSVPAPRVRRSLHLFVCNQQSLDVNIRQAIHSHNAGDAAQG